MPSAEDGVGTAAHSEGEELWASILNEAVMNSKKSVLHRNVLVLGDRSSGKSALVSRLRGDAPAAPTDTREGLGLEYSYFDVKDEDADETLARIGVYTLYGDHRFQRVLRFAIDADKFAESLAIITVDISQPWNIIASVTNSLSVLEKHVKALPIASEKAADARKQLEDAFRAQSAESATLDHAVLTNNIGIPIVVVATKSDTIPSTEREFGYRDEHFEFVQQHLRRLCLKYGAGLAFISAKDGQNCALLRRYVVGVLSTGLNNASHGTNTLGNSEDKPSIDKESVFIPIGWDSPAKIALLASTATSTLFSADSPFEDVIRKPTMRRAIAVGDEVRVDPEQAFLHKQQQSLAQFAERLAPAANVTGASAKYDVSTPPSHRARTAASEDGASAGGSGTASPGGAPGAPATGPQGEVLANFFNSLLKKPASSAKLVSSSGSGGVGAPSSATAGAGSAGSGGDAALRKEAAAELDRIRMAGKRTGQK
eukprot:Opistho-2@34387